MTAIAASSALPDPARAADACPNAAFRSGAGAALPDCRAYEQVSPTEKNGVPVSAFYPVRSSADGTRSLFSAAASIGGDESNFFFNPYVASRGASWSTARVNPPQADVPPASLGGPVQALSPDLTKAVVVSRRKLTADAQEGAGNLYLRDVENPSSYRLIATGAATGPGNFFGAALQTGSTLVYSASPDYEHIAVSTPTPLLPGVPDDGQLRTYRWDAGELRVLGLSGNAQLTLPPRAHRFSDDGQRFTYLNTDTGATAIYQQQGSAAPTLLTRRHFGTPAEQAEPQPGSPQFFSSPDGSSVTFSAYQPLLAASVPDPFGSYSTIYRWNAANDTLVDLLAGKLNADEQKNGNTVLLAGSDDGRYVYFNSSAPLAAGAVTGNPNLYVLDVEDNQVRLITEQTLESPDRIRLSEDGSRVAFATAAPIGGYDNTSAACTTPGNTPDPSTPCSEVWTYDAATPSQPVTCVSCPDAGARPAGNATFGFTDDSAISERSHAVTDDGRVYFDTPERFASTDGNRSRDVYEYRPGGERRLISGGAGGGDATLGDISPDASSVFFVTAAGLVPQDADGTKDSYVARVGGGLAAQQTPPAAADQGCAGSDCQGAPPAGRPRPVPGSALVLPFTPPVGTTFKVGKPSSASLRRLAQGRTLTVRVRVGGPGRVSLRARAKLGKRTRTVGTASATAKRAGTVSLRFKLSRAARRELARKRRLRVAATVSFSKAPKGSTLRFTLKRTGTSSKGGGR